MYGELLVSDMRIYLRSELFVVLMVHLLPSLLLCCIHNTHTHTHTYTHTRTHTHTGQSTATVVVIQPTCFRDSPVLVTDSNGQQVMTRVEYHSGTLTWLICCLVCWFTGCWCIALIPFCIDDAKDVHHFTPTDNRLVGIYKRL